jgi:hypothetical protein
MRTACYCLLGLIWYLVGYGVPIALAALISHGLLRYVLMFFASILAAFGLSRLERRYEWARRLAHPERRPL